MILRSVTSVSRRVLVAVLLAVVTHALPGPARAAEPTVARVSPARVTLYAGVASTVRLTLSGDALHEVVTVAVVDQRGTPVAGLGARLTGSPSATQRTLEIRGDGRVPAAAGYRLRLVARSTIGTAGEATVDVPLTLLQLDVVRATSYAGHGFAVTPRMSCAECHAILEANVPNAYAWDVSPVVHSDVAAHGLATSAAGATVSQIVRGERVARTDGQKCTVCHGSSPSNGATVPLSATTTSAFMCQMVPVFIEKDGKPQGLKNFFANWKNRHCP